MNVVYIASVRFSIAYHVWVQYKSVDRQVRIAVQAVAD